jgi:cobalt-zinc-cadmium resistance protein CzcA
MNKKLSGVIGVNLNFSQPIMDNVEEAVSGVKGSICLKVFGDSLPSYIREEKRNNLITKV